MQLVGRGTQSRQKAESRQLAVVSKAKRRLQVAGCGVINVQLLTLQVAGSWCLVNEERRTLLTTAAAIY